MTALHYASKSGHAEVCQHLLDVGATEEILDWVCFTSKIRSPFFLFLLQNAYIYNDCFLQIERNPEFYAANYPTELVFRKRRPEEPKKPPTPKPKTPPPKPVTPPPPKPRTPPPPKTPTPPPPKSPTPPPPKAPTPPPPKTPTPPPPRTPTPPPPKTPTPPPPRTPTPPPQKSPSPPQKPRTPSPKPESPPQKRPQENQEKERNTEEYDKFHYDRDPQKWDYKKGKGNFERRKDKQFEWSEDFQKRQKQSVYDRLMGGGKTLKKKETVKKEEVKPKKQSLKAKREGGWK